MAFAGDSDDLSSGHGLRECGRGAASRSRVVRGQAPSWGSTVKLEGQAISERTPTRPVDRGMAPSRSADRAWEPAVVIDLTSSGDEQTGVVAGG